MTIGTPPIRFLFLALFIANFAFADDWPIYLRDLAHTSYNPNETTLGKDSVKRLNHGWIRSVETTVSAAPTVVDGTLYAGAWDGFFYALDATSGEVRWRTFAGVAPPPNDPVCFPGIGVASQATVEGDVVYVAGGDSNVYALNRATGDELWRVRISDPKGGAFLWASLFIYDGSLYAGLASLGGCPLTRGGIARIDLANPKEPLFRYLAPEGEAGGGVWSTPAIDVETNTLYLASGTGGQDQELGFFGATFMALDATTLEIKAHRFLDVRPLETDLEWGSSPVLFETADGEKLVAATAKDGFVYAFRRDNLELKWKQELAISCS
ncbi:MAG: PQQ-binding-like beta-propeller repeat protein, partial [Bryobacteraceae bacterium]